MDKATSGAQDIAGFTALRGLAAWWVVLYHVRDHFLIYWPHWLDILAAKGYLAVDFFFLLSGFVIQLTYGHKIEARGPQVMRFWIKRLARIYPLHLLSLILVILYSAALVTSGRPLTPNYDMSHLWMQGLLIHNWSFTDHLAWNVPSWSISTEWGAYLLFPLWTVALQVRKKSSIFLCALLLLMAASLFGLYASRGYDYLGQNIMHYGLLRCLLQFAMGTIICIIWQRHGHRRGTSALAILTAVSLAVAAWLFSWSEILWLPLFWAAWLYAVANLSALLPRGGLMRFLVFLGDTSYATYLLHYVLFIYWKALFWTHAAPVPLWHLYAYASLLLLFSALSYYYFEKPAQHWVQGLWPGEKNPSLLAKNRERAGW